MSSSSTGSVDEETLIRFMQDPASYPHAPDAVRLIQTHASLVFVASPFVYKIKKPVDFGFLDYSTLEKRRHFCERELRLNQRLCPEGYLEVVPVTLEAGQLRLDGKGEIVEYALQMQEFSPNGFFDQKVDAGKATDEDIDRIVATLQAFYVAQHPTEEIEAWGNIDKLRVSTDENFAQTESFIGKTLTSAAFAAIRHFTNRFYEAHTSLLQRRVTGGWIRACHGDLHLEHIHLTPEHLRIYDCIEFNDRFRYVDVASDAAFLAMDLDFRNQRSLSRHFEQRIAEALKDEEMWRLLPFYKCYRAYVRGKVESLHSVSPEASGSSREKAAERAASYFRLALRYAIAGSDSMLIAVMGRVASGKSTVAEGLGSELGWPVFSADTLRKELAGVPLHERVGEAARDRLYSSEMSTATYQRMEGDGLQAAKAGGGAILDATFSRRSSRSQVHERASKAGIAMRFVHVRAGQEQREERLKEREIAGTVLSDARLEDLPKLDEAFEGPVEDGQCPCIEVKTGSDSPPLESLLKALAENGPDLAPD